LVITTFNAYKLFAMCITTIIKYWDDNFPTNKLLADVAGIKISDFNTLEIEFLRSGDVCSELYSSCNSPMVVEVRRPATITTLLFDSPVVCNAVPE
jgi:hypothetical protein